jgi:phytoene dehydrogenase-like protein
MQEAHLQLAGGLVCVRGGPGALTRALAEAARGAGADIQTGATVERIVTRDEQVTGVVVNGVERPAQAVLSAIDPKTTFLKLVDPVDLTPDFVAKVRNYRARGTVAKINVALSALPGFAGVPNPEALSGRVHIGPSLEYMERAFDHAKYGEVSAAPWLDVRIPSIADPELAPAGAHVMSIYAQYAPYAIRGASWDAEAPRLLERVMTVLDEHAPGIRGLVVAAQTITPDQLEREYGFHGGHIFHGELALDQLFTMRPLLGHGRYDSPVRGLYLCGGGTHPGGFLTGTSGRLAAQLLTRA